MPGIQVFVNGGGEGTSRENHRRQSRNRRSRSHPRNYHDRRSKRTATDEVDSLKKELKRFRKTGDQLRKSSREKEPPFQDEKDLEKKSVEQPAAKHELFEQWAGVGQVYRGSISKDCKFI